MLAAGRGERLGSALPKAFVRVAGVAMVVRSIEALAAVREIDRIQPVVPADAPPLDSGGRVARAVVGGAQRQDSVAAGLAALGDEIAWVVVHDAARCLVEAEDVRRVIAQAAASGAAILARPASDTIKLVEHGVVRSTLERASCWAVQTPQVFRVALLREAHEKARADGLIGTDDAQLVERLGVDVHVVTGSPHNLKITHPSDLALAEQFLCASEGRR